MPLHGKDFEMNVDMKKMACCYVKWEDANSSYGWRKAEDYDLPAIIESVGILISEDKRCLTISTSMSESGRFVDKITIPRACVKKFRRLDKLIKSIIT